MCRGARCDSFGTVSTSPVSILVVKGTFDSGLAMVQDVLAAANVLHDEVPTSTPPPGGPCGHTHYGISDGRGAVGAAAIASQP